MRKGGVKSLVSRYVFRTASRQRTRNQAGVDVIEGGITGEKPPMIAGRAGSVSTGKIGRQQLADIRGKIVQLTTSLLYRSPNYAILVP